MGDLKKTRSEKDDFTVDYMVDLGDEKEIIVEHGHISDDEEIIRRLRGYIQRFYEIQIEKAEQENSKKDKGEE